MNQKRGKFMHFPFDLVVLGRSQAFAEEVLIAITNHPNTGSRWTNNVSARRIEIIQKLLSHFNCIFKVTGIIGRLSATGLVGIVVDLASQFLQHLHHMEAYIRINLVNKTGDKNVDFHLISEECKAKLPDRVAR
jgi:hypothetical protein